VPEYRVYITGNVLVSNCYRITAQSEDEAIEMARMSGEAGEEDVDMISWVHVPKLDSAEPWED
jgi:hypothetical protein